MRTRAMLLTAMLLAVLHAAPALAGTMEVSVDVAREIVRDDGQSRVVLKVSDLSFLNDQLVRWAVLEVPLPQRAAERDLDLFLYPATRAWDAASVSWTSPWVRPGGDWSEDAYGRSQLRGGRTATSVRFDVAGILREIAEGREANLGFVLLPGGEEGGGRFIGDERLLLSALSEAKLTVAMRPFPPRARRQG